MKYKFKNTIVALVLTLILGACGSAGNNDPNVLRVGVEAGPEYNLAEAAQKVAKEKYNLDVKLVSFTDYIMPNEALKNNDIDVNVFQTRPYLEGQSAVRGYEFEVLGNTFVYPMAAYSKKIKSIDQLQEGNVIAIPNDPSNLGRALLLMQQVGLIQLDDNIGLLPTKQNIKENRLKLEILEIEAPQLPRTLDDNKVTAAIINSNFAAKNNLIAKKDGIFLEDEKSPYVNIIVSRKDNKDDEKVKKFVEAYQSAEVEAQAEKEFKGGAVKGW
ncbi:methionine ABC transporter substrate-binding lipoprotein MetQ [Sphingobacterium sp. Mn56C]|uniref:methionine ABC transporter substrate-binding lipoprotein MetQ n=1 Tax=Sphingobacterium sp. Mn56C TaxID=3395261 RepID=UPI003BC530D7